MIAENMKEEVEKNSAVRKMFEEGRRLKKIHGPDNVYDFSLGNPNVPAPKEIDEEIVRTIQEEDTMQVHCYMSNAGFDDVRETVADSLNRKFGTDFNFENIIMTVGAACAVHVIFKTLINPDDEVIVFAPYFMEYRAYIQNYKAKMVVVPPNKVDFQPDLQEFEKAINKNTKAVLLNSPNNPTGVIYSEETIKKLAAILRNKQEEYGADIYIVSDEPYRDLAYDGVDVPFVTNYYDNAFVGYSYSKSLSLPGERIGYLVIPSEVTDYKEVFAAASIAIRILGYMNAPSLMQKVIANCIDCKVDLDLYNRNRELLYTSLLEYGFECIKPQGAFYLFIKSPLESDVEFCNIATEYRILIVPGSAFSCPGYARIAYCVSHDTIKNSLQAFKKLAERVM